MELLLDCKADVNVEDRWERNRLPTTGAGSWLTRHRNRWACTPLQDAVMAGDEQLAYLLKRKGGKMSDSIGVGMMCSAASRGDVKMLNLLIKCAGLEESLQIELIFPMTVRLLTSHYVDLGQ